MAHRGSITSVSCWVNITSVIFVIYLKLFFTRAIFENRRFLPLHRFFLIELPPNLVLSGLWNFKGLGLGNKNNFYFIISKILFRVNRGIRCACFWPEPFLNFEIWLKIKEPSNDEHFEMFTNILPVTKMIAKCFK